LRYLQTNHEAEHIADVHMEKEERRTLKRQIRGQKRGAIGQEQSIRYKTIVITCANNENKM